MTQRGYESAVLLTGFPRFEARFLARHLLASEPRTLLYCVVHDKFAGAAQQLVGTYSPEDRGRIVLLQGDAAAIDMGLSGAEVREVSARIERIYHFVQVTYLGVQRAEAEYVNVQGAREAVEMARAARALRCLVLLSTAMVSGSRTGLVRERDLDAGQSFRTVVEETCARAERVARRAMRDVPIAVVRPSSVVGSSESGEIDRFDGPYTLILLLLNSPAELAVPLPASGDVPLNLVPIDFVARAAHHIGRDPRAPGRTFHLVDPAPLPARRVFELVARAAGRRSPRGHIPSYIARSLLRAPGLDRFLRSPRAFVELLTTRVRYDSTNADEILAGTGILCPPFESYVDQLVALVQERMRERRRQSATLQAEVEDPLS
jgi:nucleoside-diphosphate-sugar epimerase